MSGEAAPFVARSSPAQLFLAFLACVMFVIAGAWMAGLLGEPAHALLIGWLSILFFGTAGLLMVPHLLDRGNAIVVDDRGFFWKLRSGKVIPWSEISAVEEMELERQRFLCIYLSHPDQYPPTTLIGRFRAKVNFGAFGDIAVNAMGTDKTFGELKEAIFAHWHPPAESPTGHEIAS